MPDLRDSILKLLQLQGNTHPFAVVRFAELDRWATDGSYESILAGDYPRRETDRDASVTEEMKNAANSYRGVVEPVRGPAGRDLPRGCRDRGAGGFRAVRPAWREPRVGVGGSGSGSSNDNDNN